MRADLFYTIKDLCDATGNKKLAAIFNKIFNKTRRSIIEQKKISINNFIKLSDISIMNFIKNIIPIINKDPKYLLLKSINDLLVNAEVILAKLNNYSSFDYGIDAFFNNTSNLNILKIKFDAFYPVNIYDSSKNEFINNHINVSFINNTALDVQLLLTESFDYDDNFDGKARIINAVNTLIDKIIDLKNLINLDS